LAAGLVDEYADVVEYSQGVWPRRFFYLHRVVRELERIIAGWADR
jgi:hypothetical protein